jgi:hypothetical protein
VRGLRRPRGTSKGGHLVRSDIAPGGTFPDYSLPDHTGTVRALSELQGQDPMIPHTLVLKPGLVIHSICNGYWFWGRPSFCDLWHDLRAATAGQPARRRGEAAGCTTSAPARPASHHPA